MIAAIKTQQLLPQWDLAAFTYRSLDFESFAAFFINFVKIYFTESRLTSAICAAFSFLILYFFYLSRPARAQHKRGLYFFDLLPFYF